MIYDKEQMKKNAGYDDEEEDVKKEEEGFVI